MKIGTVTVVNRRHFNGVGISIMRSQSPLGNPFIIASPNDRHKEIFNGVDLINYSYKDEKHLVNSINLHGILYVRTRVVSVEHFRLYLRLIYKTHFAIDAYLSKLKTDPYHMDVIPINRLFYNRTKPVYYELMRLVSLVESGQDINLICCCKPLACHGDIVKSAIEGIVKQREQKRAKEYAAKLARERALLTGNSAADDVISTMINY